MITITAEEIAAADRELDRIAKSTTPAQNRQIIDRIKRKPPMLIRTKPIAPIKAAPAQKPAPKQSPAPAQKPVMAQTPAPQQEDRPRWGSPRPVWGMGSRPAATPQRPAVELPVLPPRQPSINLGSPGHQQAARAAGLDITRLAPGADLTKMDIQQMRALAAQQTKEAVAGIAAAHEKCYRTDSRKRIW